MLLRLRWGAFGLRGRIVGAVVITTAVTLVVAALVLLPREGVLRTSAQATLESDVAYANKDGDLDALRSVDYPLVSAALEDNTYNEALARRAKAQSKALENAESQLLARLGAEVVTLVGSIDAQGVGHAVIPVEGAANAAATDSNIGGPFGDVKTAFKNHQTYYSFGTYGNNPVVRAAIWLGPDQDAVLAVRKSIDEIPLAVRAVRKALEIAALVAVLMTLTIAIPLAGTLVSRLRRLRQAALQLAIDGTGRSNFPVDRARDEVGDLSRSFSIMQRRLRQQEEARRRFVSTASHELRTPLASLEGMLELLADDLQGDHIDMDNAAVLLDRARAQSRRLARLAADLLDLSRLDAEVALRSELVELGELGRAVLAEFEIAASERGVKTVLEEGPGPAWALADPGSAARILRILLDNALRVAPRGSEVRVVVADGPMPRVSVSDAGPGVDPEERALIFDRFKRGRETGGQAGFGLGLAIGRELAQRMGGSLVLTDGDGPGATFTLTLRPTEAPSPAQVGSTAEL